MMSLKLSRKKSLKIGNSKFRKSPGQFCEDYWDDDDDDDDDDIKV